MRSRSTALLHRMSAERRQQAAQSAATPPQPAAAPPPPPPPPSQYAQPQQMAPPPPAAPIYAEQHPPPPQQVYTIAEQKKGMPTWLVGLLTIAVLGGGLFGLYKFVGGSPSSTPAKAAVPADGKAHPFQKYLEIAGVRILETEGKKTVVRYTVINHSEADLSGLEMTVVLTPTTGGEPVAVIDAKVGTVPAQGVKDMEAPMNTKLKFYELPDWQFVKATFEITAPPR